MVAALSRWTSPPLAVLVLAVLAMLSSTVALAAEAELRLVSGELEAGQSTLLYVRVRGDRRPTAPPKIAVSPEGGVNLRFRGQSRQVRAYNSQVTHYFEYTYAIEALKEGRYTIGPAEVELGTTKVSTGSSTFVVKPRDAAGQAAQIAVHAGFDTEEAWVGQVVVYRRGVRSKLRILRDLWTDPPLDGLLPPRDGDPWFAEYSIESADGRIFVKEEGHPKVVVTPGAREVPSAVVRLEVPAEGRVGPLGMRRARSELLPTEPSSLEVHPLPPAPAGFSGLVGDFTVESQVDRRDAAVGESVNWTIAITGDGTLEGFALEKLEAEGVRVYDGSPAVEARVDGDGYRTQGRFDRVLVPTRPGALQVPPVQLIAFSPSKGEYVTHEITVPEIRVRKGKGAAADAFESFGDTDEIDTDLLVAEEAYEGVRDVQLTGRAHATWLGGVMPFVLGAAALPLVLLGGLEGARGARRGWTALRERTKRERPVRDVTPRQRLARLPVEPEARLAELDAALRHALARFAEVPVAELDRDAVVASLPVDLGASVRDLTRGLDRARFAGQGSEGLEDQTRELVDAIERLGRSR